MFLTAFEVGFGWFSGIEILLNTRSYWEAFTRPCAVVSFSARTDACVAVGLDLFASVVSNGTSIVSVDLSGYVTVAFMYSEPSAFVLTRPLSFISNAKSFVVLVTFTEPLSVVKSSVALTLLNSSVLKFVFGAVISRSILTLDTVGVYFVACVNTLNNTRTSLDELSTATPCFSSSLFSAGSVAEA